MSDPIPQPKTYPVVGNLFDLNLKTPVQSMMQLAKTYGPIFALKVPTEDLLIVSSQALAHELCDETRFEKKVHGPLDLVRDFAGDGLITAYSHEKNWHLAHRILLPAFGPSFLRSAFTPMYDLAEQLMLKWERQGPEHAIDLSDDMTRLTVDTITLCAFGHRLNSFYDQSLHPFVGAMFRGLTESSARTRRVPLVTPFLLKKKARYKADIALMHAIADDLIAKRRHVAVEDRPQDILSLMLAARDPETGEQLDDLNIRHQIVTFLIAGHETTSGLLSFAIYELMKCPEALAKAKDQVDHVLRGARPTFESLTKLTYIDQILKETLRLWPTAPAFAFRSLDETTTLANQFTVKRNQTILLLLPSLHRDPLVWEEPEQFNPDRMERAKFEALPPDSWKPFGNGQRSCIGRAFALQEATLALAMVLQRFDLRHDDPAFALKIKESLTLKPDGFKIHATARGVDQPSPLAPQPLATVALSAAAASARKEPFTVMYGSHTGTAAMFADELATQARSRGFAARSVPMDAVLAELPLKGFVIAITASYDGRPPENSKAFLKAIASAKSPLFADTPFAVFGCGNKDWARTYQAVPKMVERKLLELGGELICERGEGDSRADTVSDFRLWCEKFWLAIERREEIFEIEILPRLVREGARVEAAPTTLKLLKHFGLSEEAFVVAKGPQVSDLPMGTPVEAAEFFARLPLEKFVTVAQMNAMIAKTVCPPHRAQLVQLLANGSYEGRSTLDVFTSVPSCQMSLSEFVSLIAKT